MLELRASRTWVRRALLLCSLSMSVAAVAAIVDASTARAQAPDPDEQARMHFRLGNVYYEAGRFDEAATEFEASYRLSNRPQLLYNIFLARRDASQLPQAVEALRSYLELVPDVADRTQLTARLRSMEAALTRNATPQPQPEPQPERQPPTDTRPPPTDTTVQPPPAEVVTPPPADGQPIDGADARDEALSDDEPSSGGGSGVVPWIVVGVGGAAILAGSVTGVMALDKATELESMCPNDACPPGFESVRDDGRSLASLTNVLIGAGVATLGVGVALFFLLDDGGESRESTPTANLACGADGCAGAIELRF